MTTAAGCTACGGCRRRSSRPFSGLVNPRPAGACALNYLLASASMNFEIGLATFADLQPGVTPQQRMKQLIQEAELADQLGLDVFAVGEHHRPDYLISSPAVALAAIAARTSHIRLSSAVTVLSSEDPVRV